MSKIIIRLDGYTYFVKHLLCSEEEYHVQIVSLQKDN
jgi:hypothetical protein